MFASAQTLLSILRYQAEHQPNQHALATIDQPPLTYRNLLCLAEELGGQLREAGIGADQRVALAVPDGAQMVFGMITAGAATQTLLLPPTMAAEEFAEVLQRCRCDLALIHANHPHHFREVATSIGTPVWTVRHENGKPAGTWSVADTDARGFSKDKGRGKGQGRVPEIDDVAIIFGSSGTTGRAKIVPRTHRNVFHFSKAIIDDAGLTPDDITIIATPNHLSMGSQATGMVGLQLGGLMVVNDGPYEPGNYLRMLREFRPSFMTASPAYFRNILAALDAHQPPIDTSSIRVIRVSSDAMPAEVRAAVEERFGVSVDSSYSASEALSVAVRTSADNHELPTFLGRISSDIVQIVDDDGNQLARGEVGEIAVSHPAVSPYYIDDPELTAQAFCNHRFRIGDLGYIDEADGLHFVSRKADIINRGGLKIAPSEVERALGDHPAISQCSVFAIPHPRLGEEIALAVVPAQGQNFTETAMRTHLATRLGASKWPRRLFLLDDLPRNAVGKVLRRDLSKRFAGTLATDVSNEAVVATWPMPATALVAGLWSYVLEATHVRGDTSFIEAGGDSLQAGILQAEMQTWFDLPLEAEFLLSPDCTPMALGQRLAARQTAG